MKLERRLFKRRSCIISGSFLPKIILPNVKKFTESSLNFDSNFSPLGLHQQRAGPVLQFGHTTFDPEHRRRLQARPAEGHVCLPPAERQTRNKSFAARRISRTNVCLPSWRRVPRRDNFEVRSELCWIKQHQHLVANWPGKMMSSLATFSLPLI